MNAKELVQITPEWNSVIPKGALIGFGSTTGKITAAYPVYSVDVEKKQIKFVLYTSTEGRPCLDGVLFDAPNLYINKEPIVFGITEKLPYSVTDRLVDLFKEPAEK